MLEIYDKNKKKVAILENALEVHEEKKLNSINLLEFSLPYNEEKNKYCKPFNYARVNNGDFYRILPSVFEKDELGFIHYECEHAIATLLNTSLHGYHTVGGWGYPTTDVINYILDHQSIKEWNIGSVDFNRRFEYGWENETLLAALFSIANPFEDDFKWEFKANGNNWKINLKKISLDEKPKFYILNKKNMLRLVRTSDPKELCTKLYPYGYGEGVNQLNIKDINNNKEYIQSPQSIIDKYGIIERVWIDRRYENKESLKAAAKKMLKALQEPRIEYEVDFVMLSDNELKSLDTGDIVCVIDSETGIKYKNYVTEIYLDYDEIENSKITIANTPEDIASSISDLADRQRIEMSYAQGATQIYGQSVQLNADAKDGAEINFYIPQNMRIINHVKLKVKCDYFRAYSKAIKGGGGTTETTTFQGGGTRTSRWEPGYTRTSTWDGEIYDSITSDGGDCKGSTTHDTDLIWAENVDRDVYIYGEGLAGYAVDYHVYQHEHRFEIPEHSHEVEIEVDGHDHDVKIDGHDHEIDITHEHLVTLIDHEHEIKYGIHRDYSLNDWFKVYVNDKFKSWKNSKDFEFDITDDLCGKDKMISRGCWHSVKITPQQGLAYISIDLNIQGFVQSRGDKTV